MTDAKKYNIGGVEIREIILRNFVSKPINITKMFTHAYIQEDIFAPVSIGAITILDKDGLRELFPIIANEYISITYRTFESFDWVTREFFVYSITGESKTNDNVSTYTLNFASHEYMVNQKTALRKSFVNQSPSDIVKNIMSTVIGTKKPIDVEDSMGISNYIATGLTPIKVISMMTSRAKSKINQNGAAYLFFENKDGFCFKSLESLYKKAPIYYVADVKNDRNSRRDDETLAVLAVSIHAGISTAGFIASGAGGVKTKSLDLLNKSIKDVSYDHYDDEQYRKLTRTVGQDPSLKLTPDKFEFASNEGLNKFIVSPNGVDTTSFKAENTSVRYAQLASIATGPKVNLEVTLNSALTVGDMIDLKILSQVGGDTITENGREDSFTSGKYLATCVRHIFKRDSIGVSGSTSIELSRDSYNNSHDELVGKNNQALGI